METFEIDAYLDLLTIRTRALLSVPHRWMAIQRLAAQLLDKQTVRYRDARATADQAIADFSRMAIEQQNHMYQDAQVYRESWKAKKGSSLFLASPVTSFDVTGDTAEKKTAKKKGARAK